MSRKNSSVSEEQRRIVVLRNLAELGTMSMLELGFNASPQTVRNMAASGLVSVSVTLMPRGKEVLAKLTLKAQRRSVRALKRAQATTQEKITEAA